MTQTVVCLSVALAHNGDDDKGRNEEKRGRADGGQSLCLRVVRELSTILHRVYVHYLWGRGYVTHETPATPLT